MSCSNIDTSYQDNINNGQYFGSISNQHWEVVGNEPHYSQYAYAGGNIGSGNCNPCNTGVAYIPNPPALVGIPVGVAPPTALVPTATAGPCGSVGVGYSPVSVGIAGAGLPIAGGAPIVSGGFPVAGGAPIVSGGFPVAGGAPIVSGGFPVAGGAPVITGGFPVAGGAPIVSGAGLPIAGGAPVIAGAVGGPAPILAGGSAVVSSAVPGVVAGHPQVFVGSNGFVATVGNPVPVQFSPVGTVGQDTFVSQTAYVPNQSYAPQAIAPQAIAPQAVAQPVMASYAPTYATSAPIASQCNGVVNPFSGAEVNQGPTPQQVATLACQPQQNQTAASVAQNVSAAAVPIGIPRAGQVVQQYIDYSQSAPMVQSSYPVAQSYQQYAQPQQSYSAVQVVGSKAPSPAPTFNQAPPHSFGSSLAYDAVAYNPNMVPNMTRAITTGADGVQRATIVDASGAVLPAQANYATLVAHSRPSEPLINGLGLHFAVPTVRTSEIVNNHGLAGPQYTDAFLHNLAVSISNGTQVAIPPNVFIVQLGNSKKGTPNYCLQTSQKSLINGKTLIINGTYTGEIQLKAGTRYYFYYTRADAQSNHNNAVGEDDDDEDKLIFATCPKALGVQPVIAKPAKFICPLNTATMYRVPDTAVGFVYLTSTRYIGAYVLVQRLNPNTLRISN